VQDITNSDGTFVRAPRVGRTVWFATDASHHLPGLIVSIADLTSPTSNLSLFVFDPAASHFSDYVKANVAYHEDGSVASTWRWPSETD